MVLVFILRKEKLEWLTSIFFKDLVRCYTNACVWQRSAENWQQNIMVEVERKLWCSAQLG